MPNGNVLMATTPRDYHDVIAKVASVKDLDVTKLKELMDLQEAWERRQATTHYNEQMALAQAAMTTVSKDSSNPQTRSRYASLPALDNAIRPIYTRFGFSIEFNEETSPERQDSLLLVAYVNCGAETRRRTKWIPVQTTGIQGRAVMTLTHASVGAVTYGRRALLKMIFNLAEEDRDGNQVEMQPEDSVEKTPDALPADQILKNMERCATAAELETLLNTYKGRWGGTPKEDVERVRRRRDEMRTGFATSPKEGEAADGDHVAG